MGGSWDGLGKVGIVREKLGCFGEEFCLLGWFGRSWDDCGGVGMVWEELGWL